MGVSLHRILAATLCVIALLFASGAAQLAHELSAHGGTECHAHVAGDHHDGDAGEQQESSGHSPTPDRQDCQTCATLAAAGRVAFTPAPLIVVGTVEPAPFPLPADAELPATLGIANSLSPRAPPAA